MPSIFEPAHEIDPSLSVTKDELSTLDLKGRSVLVLGDSALALAALERARQQGANVVHAAANQTPSADTESFSASDYDSIVRVFEKVKSRSGSLDLVIAGFALPRPGSSKTADETKRAVDHVLKPMIHSAKLALYHFRRDRRSTADRAEQRFVALVESADLEGNSDPVETGVAMAVLGMYRSARHHWNAAGVRLDLIIAPAELLKDKDLAVSAVFAKSTAGQQIQSTIRLISQGQLKKLPPAYGQLSRPPAYAFLDKRLSRIVCFNSAILNFKARQGSTVRKLAIVLPLGLAAAWWTDAFHFASAWAFLAAFAFLKAVLG